MVAGWQAYTHFAPSGSPEQPTPTVTASGGGVASSGDLRITQTGPGTLYIGGVHGISPEQFQRVSAELGVTQAALESFFKIIAYDITSSAFYWPFPFADGDPNNYVHNSTKDDQLDPFPIADGGTMNYTAWGFTQEDNFCRIEIDKPGKALRVHHYDRAGKLLKVADEKGKLIGVNTLPLAAWK